MARDEINIVPWTDPKVRTFMRVEVSEMTHPNSFVLDDEGNIVGLTVEVVDHGLSTFLVIPVRGGDIPREDAR